MSSHYSVWCNYFYMPQIPASSSKVLIWIYSSLLWMMIFNLSIITVASENSKNSCTCHILSSLTWVVWIMNFMCPTAVYFWTKNLFLETWRFSHLGVTSNTSVPGTGSIQSAENLPNVSHTKNLKVSLFLWWIGQKTMCKFHISCLGQVGHTLQ